MSPALQSPSRASGRRPVRRTAVAAVVAALVLPGLARAAGADDAVVALQHEWEVIRYEVPAPEREKRFEALAAEAHRVSQSSPGDSGALVWEGIIVSSWAGEKGGLGALGLAKRAKALYEEAIRIDPAGLDGSAYDSLAVLYEKVPGWPLGFGDGAKAKELFLKALAINPTGIDANYFYGEYLLENRQPDEAVNHLERALQAPPRPGRQLADAGRRAEAQALLDKLRAK